MPAVRCGGAETRATAAPFSRWSGTCVRGREAARARRETAASFGARSSLTTTTSGSWLAIAATRIEARPRPGGCSGQDPHPPPLRSAETVVKLGRPRRYSACGRRAHRDEHRAGRSPSATPTTGAPRQRRAQPKAEGKHHPLTNHGDARDDLNRATARRAAPIQERQIDPVARTRPQHQQAEKRSAANPDRGATTAPATIAILIVRVRVTQWLTYGRQSGIYRT